VGVGVGVRKKVAGDFKDKADKAKEWKVIGGD